MGFFDDSHVTDVGLQGSAGPSVGFGEMVSQGFRQQLRVDSALALDTELRTRWLDSLRKAEIQQTDNSDPDRFAYAAFAQSTQGQPIDVTDLNPWQGDLTERFKGMAAANETIKKLSNPEIKSFEQILEEVSQLQHEVEGDSSSMYERSGTGGIIASLLGAIGGSFTTRDPLNIATAPIGVGRTIVARIASDMGIAAAVTGVTEIMDVAPARKIVGLPERDPLLNIATAAVGAGIIRGGLEGIGAGVRSLRGPDIDFDLRDAQLSQMFEANSARPSARAGAAILNDVTFIERNNPYGPGHQANTRFLAELQSVQRAMNGEPMTAIARVLPPVPYEYIKKAADFEIVREQAPQVYAKMEAAQAKVKGLSNLSSTKVIDDAGRPLKVFHGTTRDFNEFRQMPPENGDALGQGIYFTSDREFAEDMIKESPVEAVKGKRKRQILSGGKIKEVYLNLKNPYYHKAGDLVGPELTAKVKEAGHDGIIFSVEGSLPSLRDRYREVVVFDPNKIVDSSLTRRATNAEYQAAYRAVEAEATRLREQQTRIEAVQQHEAAGILASEGLPFTGPLLRHDNIESLVDRINAFNDTLDERTAARFVRETLGEGEDKVEVEVWEKDGGIDIGLKDPVDPNFKFVTDEGEMTVAQAMRDLQDDTDLVEAIKGCAI